MHRSHHHSLLLLLLPLLLLLLLLLLPLFTQGCVEEERQALLDLKRGVIVDYYNFLESWNSSSSSQEDCCGWFGIKCRWNGEGHVIISLNLSYADLDGKISPSLLSLKHLEYLDLSYNGFQQGNPIPPFIGNFSKLKTLNLACSGFAGPIPPQLGMLRNLKHLDLSLNLDHASFGGAIPPQLGMLRNLEELDLSWSAFQGAPIPAFIGSLSNLTRLSLGYAGFGGAIPPQLGMLRNLEVLDLSGNDFLLQGTPIPAFIGNLSNLIRLNLSDAGLGGAIPPQLGTLQNLEHLDLSDNHFLQGTPIPPFIGSFSNLTKLSLADAGFGGALPPQLGMLRNLEQLDLSYNNFQQGTPIPPFIGNFSNLTTLDLSNAGLGGAIPPQLGMLRNLEHLDLSGNNFQQGTPIPPFIGNFSNLISLNLAGGSFGGAIPPQLGMLRNLEELDLSDNNFRGAIPPQLGMLRNLEHLDLSRNDFVQGTPIPPFIGNFCNLTGLHLEGAGFGGAIPPQLGMLRKLQYLYLSISNSLDSGGEKTSSSYPQLYVEDFRWISNLSSLERLQFQNVDMGRVSDWEFSLSRLPFLRELILDSCKLTSSLHGGILPSLSSGNGGFASLQSLYLSHNKQLGKSFFPTWFFSLNNLSSLYLADCSLSGVLTEHHFRSNLTLLEDLDMSDNPHLHIQINPDWVPPFNLSSLDFSSCQVGPSFPLWLRTQQNLQTLILSSAGLRDSLPTWIWGFSSTLEKVDLSQNQLYGFVPDFHPMPLGYLDLSSNNFSSQLPAHLSSTNIEFLNLSYNSFSGCLSQLLCHEGTKSKFLQLLDLDNNLLSGNMSDCWEKWNELKVVSIRNNNLIGEFSNSLTHLGELTSLHLRNNNLWGTLTFLEKHNWTNLMTLDLGVNKFNGSMKSTSWKMFPKLRFLMLESNEISGIISREICNLENLQILNLASNNLFERIPICFKNFRGMKVKPERSKVEFVALSVYSTWYNKFENLQLFIKGRVDDYNKNLGLVTLLDISNNYLSGEIPKELMYLTMLYSLNLSRNHLTGTIPMNIGDMRLLSSLDLSMNQLLGGIPQTISQLTSLDHLNLSHNNLTGRIPLSTQLQSFDPSSYIGNTLCGKPLLEKCDEGDAPGPAVNEPEGDDSCIGFYLGFLIGFGAGTSAIFFILLFRQSWRIAYFRIVDNILNKLF